MVTLRYDSGISQEDQGIKSMTSFSRQLREAKDRPAFWVERAKHDFAILVANKVRSGDVAIEELALKSGMAEEQIDRLLRGDEALTLEMMVCVSQALGFRLSLELVAQD